MKNKFQKLLDKLKKLNLPDGEYAVYGSGPLAVREIREAKDLDVIVTDNLYQKLKEKYPKDSKWEMLKIEEIEIHPSWAWEPKITDLKGVIKRAEVIKGLRFVRLDDLLNCKKKMGREKDFDDIKLIENFMKNKEFEICVRAIIFGKNGILICKDKKKGYYFFPGGHLRFGEKIQDAISREIKEELNVKVKKIKFIGLVDNFYGEAGEKHHEINLVFDTKVDKISERSRENHIDFLFFDKNRFKKEKVLPIALQKSILKWLKNKKIFWASQIYNKSINFGQSHAL